MSTLLEQKQRLTDTSRGQWLKHYRAILLRAENPDPSDAASLAELQANLGLSDADVESDARAIANVHEWSQQLRGENAMQQLGAEVAKIIDERHESIRARLKSIINHVKDPTALHAAYAALFRFIPMAELNTMEESQRMDWGAVMQAENTLGAATTNEAQWQRQIDETKRQHPRVF